MDASAYAQPLETCTYPLIRQCCNCGPVACSVTSLTAAQVEVERLNLQIENPHH